MSIPVQAPILSDVPVNTIPKVTASVATQGIPVLGPSALTDDGTTLRYKGSAVGNAGNISGLTAGYLPKAGSADTLNANSHLDDGVTAANTLTATEKLAVVVSSAPSSDVQTDGVNVASVAQPSVDMDSFTNGMFVSQTVKGSHRMWSTGIYSDLGVGENADTPHAVEAIAILGEIDINQSTVSVDDAAAVAGVWFPPGAGTAAITRIAAFWSSPQGPTGAQFAYGFRSDTVAGMGSTRSAAFYCDDQGNGANDYAIFIAGGKNDLGPGNTKTGILQPKTVYSVAGTPLPSAVTAGVGARAFVSDATSNVFAAAYAGGGSNKVPVYSDGAAWHIG